jgi:peptidyl-prolyl cis-trans isomerase A (cyclophilin A)
MTLRPLATATALLALFVHLQAQAERVQLNTSLGAIELELDAEKAPATVANFIGYVKNGHYDGLIFHRVIPGFMIQGGGMDTEMAPRATAAPVRNESANGLSNLRGTIAMARTRDPDSATSQFFINTVDNQRLDGMPGRPGYTVFGKVAKGMEVVDRISQVATTSRPPFRDVPVTPVVIESATLLAAPAVAE